MNDKAICIWIEQVTTKVNEELNQCEDIDRNCRLQNVIEHLRRAWHEADGSAVEYNDLIPTSTYSHS